MSNHHLLIKDLTVSYDRIPAIHHLDLDLVCGHCIGLLGPNGAGKTTLIKALTGLVPIETGSVKIKGHDAKNRTGQIAYLPQRGLIDWDFPITVRGMVEMGRFAKLGGWGLFSDQDHAIVAEALRVSRLESLADRQISALSGGQQQRAFLARAYAQQAEFYLLDEPFNGLDTNAQNDLRDILRTMVKQGKLVLVSHHDLKSVPELFDQVILLNGELVAFGSLETAFTPENIGRTYSTQIMTRAH
jgi:ABC-type Mn2+/Zn2+ transport system ATPase subunit